MDSEDLTKAIHGWLDKQGFPLEMRVANLFSKLGYGTRQGWFFPDPEEDKPREIDILTFLESYGGHPLMIMAVIECKWSEKPFVVFTYSNRSLNQINPEIFQSNPTGKQYIKKIQEKSLTNSMPLFAERIGSIGYSMTPAHIRMKKEDSKQNIKSNKDDAFNALMKVSKATYSIVDYYTQSSEVINRENDSADYILAFIAMPIIVIDAPLFECFLNTDNKIEIQQVPMSFINWSYPKTGNIPIRVYTISELPRIASELLQARNVLEKEKIFL